jgi:ATP:ADP antiporter, AAA family
MRAAAGFTGFFFLLASLSVLRPVRDQAGIAAGVAGLRWMFTATLAAALLSAPLFALLASHLPRARYLSATYRLFAAGLLAAWLGMRAGAAWAHAALFIWAGVYNLLAVSLFWALLTDAFDRERAPRHFGVIAAGGTAGTLAGPLIVEWLVRPLGPANLLLVCAALLEIARQAARALRRDLPPAPQPRLRDGLIAVARSDFLRRACGYVALLTWTGTLLYVAQARMVAAASADAGERTLLFARVDLAVNLTTLLFQGLVAGRLRVRGALAALPLVSAAGFVGLGTAPSLAMLAAAQGLRKAVHFGLERPARETLFTTLPAGEKYTSKAFIDTAVYRGGDALGGWFSQALPPAALLPAAIALCALWLASARLLARRGEAVPSGVR